VRWLRCSPAASAMCAVCVGVTISGGNVTAQRFAELLG
jgi:hypothetical protein